MEEVLEDTLKAYMRKRVFGLLLTNFLENLNLKRISVDVGGDTKLDLSRKEFEDAFRLNTLESISHTLLNDIMPLIEKKPSFFSVRERSICEKEIRGTVDWPQTFRRNLAQGQIFGKDFVVVNPRQEWDTPENLLSMLSLLDILKNTSYFKRTFKESVETSRWSEKVAEGRVLDAIAQESLRRTMVPYFRKIEEKVEEFINDPSRIEELEREFERRLQLNLIRNPGYREVYDWRKELTGQLDVQKESTRILRDIPGEGQEYLSRIYELWTLFEVADALEEQVHLFKYYSQAEAGPLFSGTLPNPSRGEEPAESVDIQVFYLPAEKVAEKVWKRSYERKDFLRTYYQDDPQSRAVLIQGSAAMVISPSETRRVQTSIGVFPRYAEVPEADAGEIDLLAIPLHPSEDREPLNRKLLFSLTKYIRGLPFSSESKGVLFHPATWTTSTGHPGEIIQPTEQEEQAG
jgi:hypothetical protein